MLDQAGDAETMLEDKNYPFSNIPELGVNLEDDLAMTDDEDEITSPLVDEDDDVETMLEDMKNPFRNIPDLSGLPTLLTGLLEELMLSFLTVVFLFIEDYVV